MARLICLLAVVFAVLGCLSEYCNAGIPNGLRNLVKRASPHSQRVVDPKVGDAENLELQPIFLHGQHRSGGVSGAGGVSPPEAASGEAGTMSITQMQQLLAALAPLMASAPAAAPGPSPPPEYG
ncbi:hypothetical protein RvY_02823 [Ramazzottius varieornatus]|uniref:Uncharacterized protein n=1 Tax=Ramazzottius varieornatus TaxID=947166 RepID=A0A1D1UVK3_RAMVA|nr:hypothetical protein RvY_02823 [Ramazzottius varieornatus]